MTAPLLQVEGLHAGYGRVEVLFGIAFTVAEGGITAILGANGAGKTTTLRALSALIPPRGHIRFQGDRIDGKATEAIARRGIAHVPDGRDTLAGLSVEENLGIGGYTQPASTLQEGFERVFRYFPRLRERRRQQAGTLSGGEQQMLAIGRALMSRPRLLILDEPSLGLAPIMVKAIFEAITRINAEGTTVLLVEQNLVQSLRLSHRGYVLETGRIVLEGSGADLLANPHTRKAFLGVGAV